jgi:hypothetical protein
MKNKDLFDVLYTKRQNLLVGRRPLSYRLELDISNIKLQTEVKGLNRKIEALDVVLKMLLEN